MGRRAGTLLSMACSRRGLRYVCDPGIDAMLEGYLRRASREGRLPLPVAMLFVSKEGLFLPPIDRLDGPVTGETLDGLPVGALKFFADGGSRCAVCVGLGESLVGVGVIGRSCRAVTSPWPAPRGERARAAPVGRRSPAACRLLALPARRAGVALRGGGRARLPTGDPCRLQRRDRSDNWCAGSGCHRGGIAIVLSTSSRSTATRCGGWRQSA